MRYLPYAIYRFNYYIYKKKITQNICTFLHIKYVTTYAEHISLIKLTFIRCTTLLPLFFSEIRGFIVKNWSYIYDSKYCPSLATTFSHLSGSVRISRRKN